MSKLDAQRAMREAKYARLQATVAPARRGTPPPVAPPLGAEQKGASKAAAKSSRATAASNETDSEAGAGERLCGHQSISGRTCTREHGHAQKSHRYS